MGIDIAAVSGTILLTEKTNNMRKFLTAIACHIGLAYAITAIVHILSPIVLNVVGPYGE